MVDNGIYSGMYLGLNMSNYNKSKILNYVTSGENNCWPSFCQIRFKRSKFFSQFFPCNIKVSWKKKKVNFRPLSSRIEPLIKHSVESAFLTNK